MTVLGRFLAFKILQIMFSTLKRALQRPTPSVFAVDLQADDSTPGLFLALCWIGVDASERLRWGVEIIHTHTHRIIKLWY